MTSNQPNRELYPYQVEGVRFLVRQFNGALWDEPGLGKTTQAIVAARYQSLKRDQPILVVCPSTLRRWWKHEIITLYPQDRQFIQVAIQGGRIKTKFSSRDGTSPHLIWKHHPNEFPRWTICHYTGIRLREASYGQIPWGTVIADEAHYMKNPKARRTQAMSNITPVLAHRIELTATPTSTNMADYWAQLRWLAPTVAGLDSYWRFFNYFVDSVWENGGHGRYRKIVGSKNQETLALLLKEYGLQRLKSVVVPQLPPLIETKMPIGLEEESRVQLIYNALQEKDRVELLVKQTTGDEEPRGFIIKNALSRLTKSERLLSCPWDFDRGLKGAKLRWLLDWASAYREPAVIVTRFRSSARRIAHELHEMRGGCVGRSIQGDIPHKLRAPIIESWQRAHGDPQFLVGTINTLGEGLNLDRAHTLICYGQVYSPILMEQVRQRVHRVTLDHPVHVIYLYVEDTTNEVVLESFLQKWSQIELIRAYLQRLQKGKEGG